MTQSPKRQAPAGYQLRVDGHLDDHWSAWFGDFTLARGWQREIERHTATQHRIEQLLQDLDDPDDPKLHPPHGHRSAKPPGCPSSAAPEATLADPDLSR